MTDKFDFSHLKGHKLISESPERDYYLAIHEAGHAVASAVLDLGLQVVTIEPPDETRLGFKTIGLTVSLPSAVTDEQRLILSACGILAEIKAKTGEIAFTLFDGLPEILFRGEDDLAEIEKLLTRWEVTKTDSGEATLIEASRLVTNYWDTIVVVAHHLLESGTLLGADVRETIELMKHT